MLPKIKYTPLAMDDLDEMFSFISEDNVSAAEGMLEKLDQQIAGLAQFPRKGSILSEEEYDMIGQGFRFIVVTPYLVFYRIPNDYTIIIHRMLHSRRDYLRELFSPRD